MQQDHQKKLTEKPLPAEHVTALEDSIAKLSQATEQQKRQLLETEQVSMHCARCHYHGCHCCCKGAEMEVH